MSENEREKGASVCVHVQSKICVQAIDIDPAQLTKPNDKRKLLGIFYLMIIINNKKKVDVVEGREKIKYVEVVIVRGLYQK